MATGWKICKFPKCKYCGKTVARPEYHMCEAKKKALKKRGSWSVSSKKRVIRRTKTTKALKRKSCRKRGD